MLQQNEFESKLLTLASELLAFALDASGQISSEIDLVEVTKRHATDKLYPQLFVTSPHSGGAIRLEVMLCDPESDERIYSLISLEGEHGDVS